MVPCGHEKELAKLVAEKEALLARCEELAALVKELEAARAASPFRDGVLVAMTNIPRVMPDGSDIHQGDVVPRDLADKLKLRQCVLKEIRL